MKKKKKWRPEPTQKKNGLPDRLFGRQILLSLTSRNKIKNQRK